MATRVLELELPEEAIGLLGAPGEASAKATEAIVLELLREARISQGKAAELLGITRWEMLDLMALTRRSVNALKAAFKPDGFNIGINMGRVAGAGIADHVHIHIVPRWSGDTNFMPVLGDVRVIPASLEEVYKRLKTAFNPESTQ